MAEVVFSNVRKVYDDGTEAVHGLDLEIADGELVVLVGPSGCGKTTVLRMVAGLEDVTDGVIEVGGRVVNELDPRERDVAMVFQNYALYPHMTVGDNIGFSLRVSKMPKAECVQSRARSGSRTSSIGGRASSRAGSASASRWGARSCASRRCS
jgi:ABC-type sugar transport system ATPase subunit